MVEPPAQIEQTYVQNEHTSVQIEQTLPETTPEIIDDDDKTVNQLNASSEPSLKTLLAITGKNKNLDQLLFALFKAKVKPQEIKLILEYFRDNPENFDKDLIRQQLAWMGEKSKQNYGVSAFAKYFITGYESRLQAHSMPSVDELKELLGIEDEDDDLLPPITLHNPFGE